MLASLNHQFVSFSVRAHCCRSGKWTVVDDSTDTTPESSQFQCLDSSAIQQPHNNAGVYLPSDSAAALEELRSRLEKLMQLDG